MSRTSETQPYTRVKPHNYMLVTESDEKKIVTNGSAYSHGIRKAVKNPTPRRAIREDWAPRKDSSYILKECDSVVAATAELYAASVFRLFVGNGNRIPKATQLKGTNILAVEGIVGITDFGDLTVQLIPSPASPFKTPKKLGKTRIELDAKHPGSYGNLLADKILAENKSNTRKNLRVFAQILVCSIVFSEGDLKEDHLVFDEKGRLNHFDFDQCFSPIREGDFPLIHLDYTHEDFEELPFVKNFKPSNLIFNQYNAEEAEKSEIKQYIEQLRPHGKQLRKRLGPQFQEEIYEAILKILIMPDFLLGKMNEIIDTHETELREEIMNHIDHETVFEKRDRLLLRMKESVKFKAFLVRRGEAAKTKIQEELIQLGRKDDPTQASNGYFYHNSYFRKKYNAQGFQDFCDTHLSANMDKLFCDLGLRASAKSGFPAPKMASLRIESMDEADSIPPIPMAALRGPAAELMPQSTPTASAPSLPITPAIAPTLRAESLDQALASADTVSSPHSPNCFGANLEVQPLRQPVFDTPTTNTTRDPNTSSLAHPTFAKLIQFLEGQISHLENCKFTRGVEDKKTLFEKIKSSLENHTGHEAEIEQILKKACRDISMVAHHRRCRSSHGLFQGSPSQSWVKWTQFCKENNIELCDGNRPTVEKGDQTISSYNEYRRYLLK